MIQKVHKSIDIRAPVERVFSYLEDPTNNPEWIESMINVKDISGSGTGSHYKCSWKMGGVQVCGETTRTEDISNKRIVDKTRGVGINTWTYTFEPHGDTTTVDLDLEYDIPIPVKWKLAHKFIHDYSAGSAFKLHSPKIANLIDKVIVNHTEREVEMDLQNIKDRLEI